MEQVLSLNHVTKLFPGVTALDDVSFGVEKGEIHAIVGENGAGKSTLIKIIGGAISPTSGTIRIDSKEYTSLTPAVSSEAGVGVVYQEFSLVPSMSVGENVCLGNKLGHKFFKDKNQIRKVTEGILKDLGLDVDPDMMVSRLSTGQQQMVEIAKLMIRNCRLLILDEPTASLSAAETENLLRMVRVLRDKGVTIIYVSHRLEEIFALTDRITVLRDGKYISTVKTDQVSRHELVKLMVGRDIGDEYPKREPITGGKTVLKVDNLSGLGDRDIHFELHKGEVLGFYGLVGSGRTEMAQMIFGYKKKESGNIEVNGQKKEINSCSKAIAAGLGLIPEDRKNQGAFLDYTIEWNIPIVAIKNISDGLFLNQKRISDLVAKYIKELEIVTPSSKQLVRNLSGGNQQKVVVAKTLAGNADILIMDEPTRGIDVNAKKEIYILIDELAKQGKSIMMISSEIEELIAIADRIIVFYEGEIMGEVMRKDFDQNKIGALASGLRE